MGVVSVITMGVVFHGLLQLHHMGCTIVRSQILSLLLGNKLFDSIRQNKKSEQILILPFRFIENKIYKHLNNYHVDV